MKKVAVYIAVSLDGYIADRKGSVDWIGGDGSDPDYPGTYSDFFATVDTILFGYTTYNQIVTELAPGRWDYAGKQSYVITHRKFEDKDGIKFTDRPVADLLVELKRGEGGRIWICGGASVIAQALEAGLVDEITVSIMPTLLGGGVKLFGELADMKKLRLISIKSGDGTVDLSYEAI